MKEDGFAHGPPAVRLPHALGRFSLAFSRETFMSQLHCNRAARPVREAR